MYYLMLTCALLGSVLTAVWLFLFLRYKNKYDSMIENIDSKVFSLKDLYFIGFGVIDIYERKTKKKITGTTKVAEQCRQLAEVFGRDNGELYYYVKVAAMISLAMTFLPIGLMLTCVMQSVLGLAAGLLLAFVFPYGVQSSINKAIIVKKDALLSEFPKMVSKLTLLVNAGMLLRRAWDEVSDSQDGILYEEMRTVTKDMSDGMTLEAAMDAFSARCGLKEIRKFSSIYVQAVKRGAGESINSMKIMADEAWEQKKQLSKQKGELAAQKLLIPNMIMFLGIMIVVVVPMISSMLGKFNA